MHTEEGRVKMRQKLELCCYKPRDTRNHQELEEARKDFPLEPSEGAWHCQHLDFGLLASRTVRQ